MSEIMRPTMSLRWSASGRLQQKWLTGGMWEPDMPTMEPGEKWIDIPKEEPKGGFQLTAEPALNGAKRKAGCLFVDLLPNEWLSSLKFADSWRGFVVMRALKHPLTERAVRLLVPKLRDIGKRFGVAGVLSSLDASTLNHWRDVFDPKNVPEKKTTESKPESPRYAEFIQAHPDQKVREKYQSWSAVSRDPSLSWLVVEFRRWDRSSRHTNRQETNER